MLLVFFIVFFIFYLALSYRFFSRSGPGVIEFLMLLASFHVFIRPVISVYCGAIGSAEFQTYLESVTLGGFALLMFYFGSFFVRTPQKNLPLDNLALEVVPRVTFLLFFFGFVLCIYLYGHSWISFYRTEARWTDAYPLAGIMFYVLKTLALILLPLCLLAALRANRIVPKLTALACIGVSLAILFLFGKRGAILAPVFYIFAVSVIYTKNYGSKSRGGFSFKSLVYFTLLLVFVMISRSYNLHAIDICNVLIFGQEYDLLWPTLLTYNQFHGVAITEIAQRTLYSLIYNYNERLSGSFFNTTDILMLEYSSTYASNGFGITPFFTQYYYHIFGLSFLPFLFFLGVLTRKVEFEFWKSLVNLRFYFPFYFFLFHTVTNAWESKIKLLLFEFSVAILTFFVVYFLSRARFRV